MSSILTKKKKKRKRDQTKSDRAGKRTAQKRKDTNDEKDIKNQNDGRKTNLTEVLIFPGVLYVL
jgi:hypothetical protein